MGIIDENYDFLFTVLQKDCLGNKSISRLFGEDVDWSNPKHVALCFYYYGRHEIDDLRSVL